MYFIDTITGIVLIVVDPDRRSLSQLPVQFEDLLAKNREQRIRNSWQFKPDVAQLRKNNFFFNTLSSRESIYTQLYMELDLSS